MQKNEQTNQLTQFDIVYDNERERERAKKKKKKAE